MRVTIAGPEGTFPGIGVSIHPDLIQEALAHPTLLSGLRPQLLLFHFDPTAGHGQSHLRGFADIAKCVPAIDKTESVLELVLPVERSVHDELFGVAEMVAAAGLPLSGILVSPAADRQSTLPGGIMAVMPAARRNLPGSTGGLSRHRHRWRARSATSQNSTASVHRSSCSISSPIAPVPIVHAADDLSVMESLEALPHIIRSTRAIIGQDKAYWIGPSTIGMRHNPYGARVMDNPANCRITMTDRDPRQTSLFAAAWMIGYVGGHGRGGLTVADGW